LESDNESLLGLEKKGKKKEFRHPETAGKRIDRGEVMEQVSPESIRGNAERRLKGDLGD